MTKLTVSLTGAVVLCCFMFVTLAYSGGGVNHKVRIKNDTNEVHSTAWVFYGEGQEAGDYKNSYIGGPGSSHTFEFGLKCPTKIRVYIGGGDRHVERCTIGTSSSCTHTCWSSKWKVTGNSSSGFHIEKD